MKNIVFTLEDNFYLDWAVDPSPAIEQLPDWYKKTNRTTPMVNFGNAKEMMTLKKCVPFLDAMSFGYVIRLNADIYIDPNLKISEQVINFKTAKPIIETHEPQQLGEYKPPLGYHEQPLKWLNAYNIKTPKGYSCLFTHPLNQTDLPFLTLSGVVDTDMFELNVNLPFFLRKDYEGLIERGTPIAQVIPFKRDAWKMKMGEPRESSENFRNQYRAFFTNAYKRMHWQRKTYR